MSIHKYTGKFRETAQTALKYLRQGHTKYYKSKG